MFTSAAESSLSTKNIDGGNGSNWSDDLDDILSTISPQKMTGEGRRSEQSKAPRFRVKWHADVVVESRDAYHGFINDISTVGATIYTNANLYPERPTLHIHVPPLSATCKPHIIEVSGRTIYIVYDGEMQLYRVAVNFLRFHSDSDRIFLDERLTKHQLKIPELALMS